MRRMKSFAAIGAALATITMPTAAAASTQQPAAKATRSVVLAMPGCEGCPVQAWAVAKSDPFNVWSADVAPVVDGKVSFDVPVQRLPYLSFSLTPGWEGMTGYQTYVAIRYQGTKPGQKVGIKAARKKTRASMCFNGASAAGSAPIKFKVITKKVRVGGVEGKTWGTLAFARITQNSRGPMAQAFAGVVGGQEVPVCG